MDFIRNKRKALSLSAIALAVIATALRTICVLKFYDKDIAYYTSGAILPSISNILYGVSIVGLAIAAILLVKKDESLALPGKISQYVALLPALALIFVSFSYAINMPSADARTVIDVLMPTFAAVAAIFFICVAFFKKDSFVCLICGCGVIAWTMVSWFLSYNDRTVPLNSPDKLFFHFACIGISLLIVAELRIFFGAKRTKLYFFSLVTALITLPGSSVPAIIGYYNQSFKVYTLIKEDLVFLAVFIYAVARALDFIKDEPVRPVEETVIEERTTEETTTEETTTEN